MTFIEETTSSVYTNNLCDRRVKQTQAFKTNFRLLLQLLLPTLIYFTLDYFQTSICHKGFLLGVNIWITTRCRLGNVTGTDLSHSLEICLKHVLCGKQKDMCTTYNLKLNSFNFLGGICYLTFNQIVFKFFISSLIVYQYHQTRQRLLVVWRYCINKVSNMYTLVDS